MRYRENESGLHILEIEITNRCNLSCSHCYVDNGQCRDMDKKTILQVIEESNRMGINRLVLTGENLLCMITFLKQPIMQRP